MINMAKVKTVNWCDFFIEHKRLEEPVITINLDGICEKITKSVMKKKHLSRLLE